MDVAVCHEHVPEWHRGQVESLVRQLSSCGFESHRVHEMKSIEDKLEIAIEALTKIANGFPHTEDCNTKYVPIHECGCNDDCDESIIAHECLARLGLRRSLFEDEDCDNNE